MQELLYQVALIGLEAGSIALKHFGSLEHSIKHDLSPITQADLESNDYIMQSLQKISSYKICSEEAILDYQERKGLQYYWLIDPLDGTKDFLAQNGGWTINIALIAENQPILGMVYAPYYHELYIALRGYGSYTFSQEAIKNKFDKKTFEYEKIRLNGECLERQEGLVACDSVFHSTKEAQDFFEKYHLKVQKYGSSLKVCALAQGKADLYPRFSPTNEWDIAACDIILQEAGGKILDCISKEPLKYNKENMINNSFIAFGKKQMGGKIYKDFIST